jgi:superfamily II DNA or RNA helicase
VQIARRQDRALEELTRIINLGDHPLLSTFEVTSASGRCYQVRIRSVATRLNSCTCPDYRTNTLGTCKHIEGVLMHLEREMGARFRVLAASSPEVAQVFLQHAEATRVRLTRPLPADDRLAEVLDRHFDPAGVLQGETLRSLPALLAELEALPAETQGLVRVDEEVHQHLDQLEDLESIRTQKQWFLRQVDNGARSVDVISTRLYPYQHDGMLHLAFGGRTLLADDMGLGKTVQALAAASLLHQLRDIRKVLVVCPASLKHQWAREIRRFTSFEVAVVEGELARRRRIYRRPPFYSIINYELVRSDLEELLDLAPDLVILDEAQRIKNWRTKTADTVKRLSSRYAFVLTGTPLENRLDELYSVFQFIDPKILGPLWRFNDRYFKGHFRSSGSFKVEGYKNLDELRRRIAPYVLRRTREEVMHDLPERIDNSFFVELTTEQADAYAGFERTVAQLGARAERRPLTPEEHQVLLSCLAKMRMICNALALHDPEIEPRQVERTAPKLRELGLILDDEVVAAGRKAILFSQWSRMLQLVEPILERRGIGYVKLTGNVPSHKRGELIERFFTDDACRVFLSTDAGGVGLNLQAASLVINLELPWNPAVLEQRVGRAHRHGQRQVVQVVNLITRGTIEERMLDTLSVKRHLLAGVLGGDDAADELTFGDSSTGLLQQLARQLRPAATGPELQLDPSGPGAAESAAPGPPAAEPADAAAADEGDRARPGRTAEGDAAPTRPERPSRAASPLRELATRLLGLLPGRILLVRRAPARAGAGGDSVLVVVDRDPAGIRADAERLLAEVWADRADRPRLLLMEREGYAAFAALTGLDPAADDPATDDPAADDPDRTGAPGAATVFKAAALAPAQDQAERRARTLERISTGLDQAGRRLRLARVLLDQEFPDEVLRPLREALGWVLNAHLALAGLDQPAGRRHPVAVDLPAPWLVHARLVEPGHLDTALAARIARLRELSEPVDADAGTDLPAPSMATCSPFLDLLEILIDLARERMVAEQL